MYKRCATLAPECRKSAYETKVDNSAFKLWLQHCVGAPEDEYIRIRRILASAIQQDLTETQRRYVTMYYFEKYTMPEIAEICGVNQSTVCRLIRIAETKLVKVLRYSSKRLQKPHGMMRHCNGRKRREREYGKTENLRGADAS